MGDPAGAFTKQLDLTLDAAHVFGNSRSKRYALVVDDGTIKSVHVEADPGTVDGTWPNTRLSGSIRQANNTT